MAKKAPMGGEAMPPWAKKGMGSAATAKPKMKKTAGTMPMKGKMKSKKMDGC